MLSRDSAFFLFAEKIFTFGTSYSQMNIVNFTFLLATQLLPLRKMLFAFNLDIKLFSPGILLPQL